MNPKHQYHLSQWEEGVYGAQSWKLKRLLHESVFVLIEKQTLTPKNGGKWSFSYETEASIHLSQRGECVYCAYSWKERRFLRESTIIAIDNELWF